MGSWSDIARQSLPTLRDHIEHLKAKRNAEYAEAMARKEMDLTARSDKKPLSPAQWIKNEYFSGSLSRDVYKILRDAFVRVYEENLFEIYLAGSIGWGKTTFAKLLNVYSDYLVSCHAVPQRAFRGMLETDQILYLNLNVNEIKAKNSYFKSYKALLESIPYFQNDYVMQRGLVNEIRFPQKNVIHGFKGASRTAAESENLIYVVLDEVNLYDLVEKSRRSEEADGSYDEAEQIFSAAIRRMQSRFMMRDGSMPPPCKIVCLCRETVSKSFMRRKIEHARKNDYERRGKALILEFSEWETKLHLYDMKDCFWIRTGTRKLSPVMYVKREEAEEAERKLGEMKALGLPKDELYEVLKVPRAGGKYFDSAKLNLLAFIREVAGRPTEGLNMLFDSREIVYHAHKRRFATAVPVEVTMHPFTGETTTFYDDVSLLRERLCREVEVGKGERRWRPIMNPTAPRFVHVDTGLTGDAAGFVMGHASSFVDVARYNEARDDGERLVTHERVPVIWFDILLRVLPPPGGEIPFSGIRGLIYTLRKLGFKIELVTMDTFQSRDMIQILQRNRIRAELVSIDRTTTPYDRLKRAYAEERVSAYEYPIFEEELVYLKRVRTGEVRDGRAVEKIDHPEGGSKDVSDGAAGVVDGIESYYEKKKPSLPVPEAVVDGVKTKREKDIDMRECFENGQWEKLQDMFEMYDE